MLAAVLFAAAWLPLHPAHSIPATGDLYTHLSVARHLARGEGFRTDVAYPLSFAYPFACDLPQPLIHRPPGFGLLLTLPYTVAGGDPAASIGAMRVLQILLLGIAAWLGAAAWLRRGQAGAALAYLVLLAANPLLAFAVDWGHTEVAASVLLAGLWFRCHGGDRGPGWPDGLLLGALGLLRPELVWLPPAWWLALSGRTLWSGATARRRIFGLLLACGALTAPWAIRNLALTGDPFFSLQAQAEHRKDTRGMPGYEVYRRLEPQPLLTSLITDPEPVARKTYRGLQVFRRELPQLVPWPLLVLGGGCVLVPIGRRFRRRREGSTATGSTGCRGPEHVTLSLVALVALYAPFDHSLRHLLVLTPILLWETSGLLNAWISLWPKCPGVVRTEPMRIASAVTLAAAVSLLTTTQPVGWLNAARDARRLAPDAAAETAALTAAPPGPAFVTTSAAPWFADRPAVWSPADDEVRRRISELLTGNP